MTRSVHAFIQCRSFLLVGFLIYKNLLFSFLLYQPAMLIHLYYMAKQNDLCVPISTPYTHLTLHYDRDK